MLVLIILAALAILTVVVFAALGRGGGLSVERNDYAPLDLGPVSATDVALLRPPTGMWGYNMQVTDEAMERIAESIRERDVRIVALEQLVTDLGREHAPLAPLASPYEGARRRRGVPDRDLHDSVPAAPGAAHAATVHVGGAQPELIRPGVIERGSIEYADPGPGRPSFDYSGPEFAKPSADHPGPDAITKPDPVHPAFEETAIDEIQAPPGQPATESARLPGETGQLAEAPERSHD